MKSRIILILMLVGLTVGCQVASPPEQPPRIAFVSDRDGNSEIYMMDRDGSNLTNLTRNENNNDMMPTWSPQANAFAFVSKKDKGGFTIRRMNIDGSELTVLSEKPPLVPIPLVWDPTGEWLAFGSQAAADVYVISATGETVRNLSDLKGRDDFQTWSLDGQSLFFTSSREGNLAIYRVDVDGGEPVRLTELGGNSTQPDWSPDGLEIVFAFVDQLAIKVLDSHWVLIQARECGGVDCIDDLPRWTPTGDQVLFRRTSAGALYLNGLWVMIPHTGRPNEVKLVDNALWFDWSPDGHKIVYTDSEKIFVMNADGSGKTLIRDLTENFDRASEMEYSRVSWGR